ncbi:DUF262 domain-containing protein [Rhodoferax sp. PAMC 29310]|uniref:GmrSD restriction endonuclease domain-containing protein n=1 Tax=Rhodoferax sp. PAMC 29310 TaxID=2822760 RepID=UPI001B31D7B2|nr:DUF262 domain-containing protein [Rhodoferax sp. PAMC 29310]
MNDTTQTTPATAPEKPVLLQPDNHNKKYEALFVEIDSGQIKLPMFQREFVWEKEQSAKLIDSILKGFPIGTFIFWKTKEELRSYKEVGNHKLPETDKGDYVQYILDGQQRITSLYAIRKGIRITKDGKVVDYRDIFINLDHDPENDEQIVVTEQQAGKRYVSVHRVLTSQVTDLLDEFPARETLKKIEFYKNKLTNYDFSTITIKDYPIEVACEVFSRINTGGKSLTVFEIMVAKTYDEIKKFDLVEKYELLRDGSDSKKECLAVAKFETLPESTIMQCVAAITLRAVRSRDILKIRRETFIDKWAPMEASLFMAIDFIRSELRVPVSQLVPYPALVVPLVYFFNATANKKPSKTQVQLLEQFFYWAGLTERYGSSTESKMSEDFNKMDAIAKSVGPVYPSTELSISAQRIAETWFSSGNGYCKSILCLLAYQQPKSFDTNGLVILDNSNLKIATSRNYHHFFPKAYLESVGKGQQPNLIANITLIDGYSNKHRIGKRAPSDYISKFANTNDTLAATLKTHLVQDIEGYGVIADDYTLFIEQRSKAIADALNAKLLSTANVVELEVDQVASLEPVAVLMSTAPIAG